MKPPDDQPIFSDDPEALPYMQQVARPPEHNGPIETLVGMSCMFVSAGCLAAMIHLAWIALVGTDAVATLPIGEDGIELSSLWLARIAAVS